jgi:hypothetical protein
MRSTAHAFFNPSTVSLASFAVSGELQSYALSGQYGRALEKPHMYQSGSSRD